jgi:hypothetical protein
METTEKSIEKKNDVKALNSSKNEKIGGGHHEDNTFTHREIF